MDPIYSRLRVRDIPPVPQEVLDAFESGSATLIPIDEKSRALTELPLRMENGISEFDDGSMMVALSCHLAGVTREMLEWWEWWFPGHVDAFRAWLPDSNFDLTYSEEHADYFNAERMPEFRPHTLYPTQVMGDIALLFKIDVMDPVEFGFDREAIRRSGDPLIFCGNIKARKGKILYTDFAYMFFPEGDGFRFSARFWAGRTNGNRFLRIMLLNRRRMYHLGVSCYREYTSLPGLLPEMYAEFNQ